MNNIDIDKKKKNGIRNDWQTSFPIMEYTEKRKACKEIYHILYPLLNPLIPQLMVETFIQQIRTNSDIFRYFPLMKRLE